MNDSNDHFIQQNNTSGSLLPAQQTPPFDFTKIFLMISHSGPAERLPYLVQDESNCVSGKIPVNYEGMHQYVFLSSINELTLNGTIRS